MTKLVDVDIDFFQQAMFLKKYIYLRRRINRKNVSSADLNFPLLIYSCCRVMQICATGTKASNVKY